MVSIEEQRKKHIVDKRQERNYKVEYTHKQREEELKLRKEMENLKRKDRQETVERIAKIQQYKREKVFEKIVQDDMRSMHIRSEKENLLEARKEMRKQADLQKQQMMETFDKMKLKGKVDQKELSKLGIESGSFISGHSAHLSPIRPLNKHMGPKQSKQASSSKNLV